MAIPIRYSLRNVWVRRSTALATAAGIALVVFVLAASRMLAAGLRQTLLNAGSAEKAIVMQADAYAESRSRVRQSALTLAAAAPGVRRGPDGAALVSGEAVAQVYLSHADDRARHASVQVRGVTDSAFQLRPEVRVVVGRAAKPGTNEAIVGRGLIGRYEGVLLGGGFELQKNHKLQIVGVFEAGSSAYESEVWADLDMVRGSFGWTGYLSSVTAQLESAAAYDGFAMALQADKEQGLVVERQRAYYERVSNRLSTVIEGLGGVVAFIFSFGAMLGAAITMYGGVSQRRKELGVLKALGFTPAQVLSAVMIECLALSIVGGAAGVLLALSTPFFDFSTVNWSTGQQITFHFVPSAGALGGALLAGTIVGSLGGVFPALKAASMDAIGAMRA
jgi:putative ABC transport system permease protein